MSEEKSERLGDTGGPPPPPRPGWKNFPRRRFEDLSATRGDVDRPSSNAAEPRSNGPDQCTPPSRTALSQTARHWPALIRPVRVLSGLGRYASTSTGPPEIR